MLRVLGNRLSESEAPFIDRNYDRVFLPLARRGCGVGCSYCYIDGPRDEVEPLSQTHAERLLDQVEEESTATLQRPLTVAIGCDTESLRNPLLVTRTVAALERARLLNLPVQLATKYVIPDSIRVILDGWPNQNYRPIVFTTVTCTQSAATVEPGAPPAAERARNFDVGNGRWVSVALVKPFLKLNRAESEDLARLIVSASPNAAVVGVTYRRARSESLDGVHPFARGWSADRPSDRAEEFRLSLESGGVRTFANTECVVDFFNHTGHGRTIFESHRYLCVGCGRCEEGTE